MRYPWDKTFEIFVCKIKKIREGYTMYKHIDFGYTCHIPSICKFFRKGILVIYLVYDKPPKMRTGVGFQMVAMTPRG